MLFELKVCYTSLHVIFGSIKVENPTPVHLHFRVRRGVVRGFCMKTNKQAVLNILRSIEESVSSWKTNLSAAFLSPSAGLASTAKK